MDEAELELMVMHPWFCFLPNGYNYFGIFEVE
jgi:hypothetical protein